MEVTRVFLSRGGGAPNAGPTSAVGRLPGRCGIVKGRSRTAPRYPIEQIRLAFPTAPVWLCLGRPSSALAFAPSSRAKWKSVGETSRWIDTCRKSTLAARPDAQPLDMGRLGGRTATSAMSRRPIPPTVAKAPHPGDSFALGGLGTIFPLIRPQPQPIPVDRFVPWVYFSGSGTWLIKAAAEL